MKSFQWLSAYRARRARKLQQSNRDSRARRQYKCRMEPLESRTLLNAAQVFDPNNDMSFDVGAGGTETVVLNLGTSGSPADSFILATDADGDDLSFDLVSGDGGFWLSSQGSSSAELYRSGSLSPGAYPLTIQADDGNGGTADFNLTVNVTAAAPVIESLDIQETGMGNLVVITGGVSHDFPDGMPVTITGVVNDTLLADSSGNFSGEFFASSLGTISASATDVWGQFSNSLDAELTSAAPSIGLLMITPTGDGNSVLVYGYASDEYPGGLVIELTGIVSDRSDSPTTSLVINEYGEFYGYYQVATAGTVTARAIDVWGLVSDEVTASFDNAAPQFVDENNASVDEYQFTIPAESIAGGSIGQVFVTDPDTNSEYLALTIQPVDDYELFTLDMYGYITPTQTLAAGATYRITVQVTDPFGGVDTALVTVDVVGDVVGGEPDISVSHNGQDIPMNSAIDVDSSNASFDFEIYNAPGGDTLTVSSIDYGGQIIAVTPMSATIAPGSSITAIVSFNVPTAGPYTAWIAIISNDPDEVRILSI